MTKISIIVPVYNVEKYISRCLDSLVNQTLNDIEIIVVNDGSIDNSQKVIDGYVKKYKNVKSYTKENGGQGSARNFGLTKSSGEYVGYVDSDDYVELDMYEKLYNKAKENDSDIVISDMIIHTKNQISYYNCTKYNTKYDVTPSACNKIFRKQIINNIKFISKIWYEDLNFTTKVLFNTNKISTVSKGLYHYINDHISTMNNNNSLKNLDMIIALDDIIKYAKENDFYDKNIISYLIFDHVLITTINRVANQNNEDRNYVLNELVKYCKRTIPDYKKQAFYKNISLNRKIIAGLNYHKLYFVSKLILKTKSKLK